MIRRLDFWATPAVLILAYFIFQNIFLFEGIHTEQKDGTEAPSKTICNKVAKGETLFEIFKRYGLNVKSLFDMREAAASVHLLKNLSPGQPYTISIGEDNNIESFVYWIDDENVLKLERLENGFEAERCKVPYETRILNLAGSIKGNLISSLGEDKEKHVLALKIADIFAWDIDFTSDLREGDTYAAVVEGQYLNGQFRKYGEVLGAVLINDGTRHTAYRFECEGKADYYDCEGRSLKKGFLRAPLSFRRISSYYSRNRFHPVLRIYRPHRGVDYAARSGTPVSATSDGTVSVASYRGQYGKLVVIRHNKGYVTYYGHLSKIASQVQPGKSIKQGETIGYVGSTGLASGPHLHYEIRYDGVHINPLTFKAARNEKIPVYLLPEFRKTLSMIDRALVRGNIFENEQRRYPEAKHDARSTTDWFTKAGIQIAGDSSL